MPGAADSVIDGSCRQWQRRQHPFGCCDIVVQGAGQLQPAAQLPAVLCLQDDLLRRMVAQYGAKNWKKIGVWDSRWRRAGSMPVPASCLCCCRSRQPQQPVPGSAQCAAGAVLSL